MSHTQKVWRLGNEEDKAPLLYTGCGLDDVWLASGYDAKIIDGEETVSVRNLDGLLQAIGRSLVRRKKLLSGKEIRFLRQQMEMTQSKLASLVGTDPQQIARYEKGHNKMPGSVDRLLRMLYRAHLKDPAGVQEYLEMLDALDARMTDEQVFAETPDGWKAVA